MNELYAALEIGTSRTVLAIGGCERDMPLKIACIGDVPSAGVRKSAISNIANATQSIRSALSQIERKLKESGDSVTIGNAYLVLNGRDISATPYQSPVPVERGKVSQRDIDICREAVRQMSVGEDRELLDIVEQTYQLDDMGMVTDPAGLSGRILKLSALYLTANRALVDNARTAASACHLELRDSLFSATCAADAVLSAAERRDGVLLLDLGGGSTGYAAYIDGILTDVNVIGIGGEHINNDIAHAFQTTLGQAEELKVSHASAVVSPDAPGDGRVAIRGTSALLESRTVSRRALDTVVNLRCKELLAIVRERLEESNVLHRLHGGVVLCGGGAAMRGIQELIRRELGLPVRIGVPAGVAGLEKVPHPEAFASVAGALLYASRNGESRWGVGDFFRGIFRSVFK